MWDGVADIMIVNPISTQLYVPRRDADQSARNEETARRYADQAEVIEIAVMKTSRAQPDAAVVAQLMATHLDAPQTRRLRRIDTAEGAAAYRSTRDGIARARASAVAMPSWKV
jgi:hypothetical protein